MAISTMTAIEQVMHKVATYSNARMVSFLVADYLNQDLGSDGVGGIAHASAMSRNSRAREVRSP